MQQGYLFREIAKQSDQILLEDIIDFHTKGNLNIDKCFMEQIIHPPVDHELLQQIEFSDLNLSPFYKNSYPLSKNINNLDLQRSSTAQYFNKKNIPFSILEDLLENSFAANINTKKRPYPSGGAIYPVDIIVGIFSNRFNNCPIIDGIYHFRPALHILQPINTTINSTEILNTILTLDQPPTASPNFCILYFINLKKALLKYRYRGYRHALMEIGSMYQQADLAAKKLNLINKLYSGFNDYQVSRLCQLNLKLHLPIIVQSFGACNAYND
jgi:SagB-type dehydrogenase family enzyme